MMGMIMRKISAAILVIILVQLVWSDAVIREFRVEPGMNKVHLLWKVTVETNVREYQILRGLTPTQLYPIASVAATEEPVQPGGEKLYEYTDRSVYKSDGRTYYYQIAVVGLSGDVVTRSGVREVSPRISAVRHTWGSIKALFR
jgi:hypothetical protein